MEFEFVYKICNKSEWLLAKQNKKFTGTKKDKEDGFIHFSDKQQILGTLKKYYLKQKDLILLKVETLKLDNLIWEQASDGNMFPHLYSSLDITNVCNVYEIVLNEDDTHTLPSNY
jgi:uncharacterized protein (DUF952 family)|tara:strand:- start:839 stop:1183 length:345 start_codon:yes stop_codon:yes gene_type:complete